MKKVCTLKKKNHKKQDALYPEFVKSTCFSPFKKSNDSRVKRRQNKFNYLDDDSWIKDEELEFSIMNEDEVFLFFLFFFLQKIFNK